MMNTPPRYIFSLAALISASATAPLAAASAQSQSATNTRAQDQATDAFGVRTGVEQIGLYSESQVRGFSLQDAGNYRLEGAYFVRAGNLVDPILARVNTRVGINALGLDFPSPSGVVEYRLRSPSEVPAVAVDFTRRDYGGILAEATVAAKTSERTSVLVGGALNRARSSAGLLNRAWRAGTVAEWLPADGARLLGFFSLNRFDLQGSYGVTVAGDRLPPRMLHPMRYTPKWGDHDGRDLNFGAVASLRVKPGLDLTASVIRSRLELPESDFVNLIIGAAGSGRATIFSNRPRTATSTASALALSWSYQSNRRLYGEIRLRGTESLFRPAFAVDVPNVHLASGLPHVSEPQPPPLNASADRVRQATVAIGHEMNMGRFRLKTGLQRSYYRREFTPADRPTNASASSPWLYDASLLADLGAGISGWAAVTRGIEEAGIAPGNAANRNEVLPAILVRQWEFGARYRTTGGISALASMFSISKPAAVLDRAGVFGLSGALRHRGLEFSVAGQVQPGLRILGGAAIIEAERGGDLVRANAISVEPPGTPRLQGLFGLTWVVPGVSGLSLDSQITYGSSRRVRSDMDVRSPDVATVDLGALQSFKVGDSSFNVRLRVVNLFDDDSWIAQRSETLDRVSRRGIRLTVGLRTN